MPHVSPHVPPAIDKQELFVRLAETSLALDRRITEGWLGAAGEVVFTFPEKEKDRDLLPSPLIAQVPEGKMDSPSFPNYRNVLFSSRAFESMEDGKALPLKSRTVKMWNAIFSPNCARASNRASLPSMPAMLP